MYREHEFDVNDRCIHCCCSRASIIINKWVCNPIDSVAVPEKRIEIQWDFDPLVKFLNLIPSINGDIFTSSHIDNNWYVMFKIDIYNKYSWHAVQIIGSIINSMHECGSFKPSSPSVDLNGGPAEHLSWVLESVSTKFTPEMCYMLLHNNMPQPVNDLDQWNWD